MNKEWLSMGKEKTMPFFNKRNFICKSIRSFYFIKTYSTIFINNYTTRRSSSLRGYSSRSMLAPESRKLEKNVGASSSLASSPRPNEVSPPLENNKNKPIHP
jgi:hypothetical protein